MELYLPQERHKICFTCTLNPRHISHFELPLPMCASNGAWTRVRKADDAKKRFSLTAWYHRLFASGFRWPLRYRILRWMCYRRSAKPFSWRLTSQSPMARLLSGCWVGFPRSSEPRCQTTFFLYRRCRFATSLQQGWGSSCVLLARLKNYFWKEKRRGERRFYKRRNKAWHAD